MAEAGRVPEPAPAARPSQAWQAGVAAGRIQPDPSQQAILPALDRVHAAILAGPARPGWLGRWRRQAPADARGLYLWGGVGRGKTFLIDLLAAQLPRERVLRRHFHRWMGEVHARLRQLRAEGQADPLDRVAADLAGRCRLLCLDEFIVHDIGDAMLLSGLLTGLFERGVLLATSSNTAPGQLYRDGLQRRRFEPAIALLERHCQVLELASATDYRLANLSQAPIHLVPADAGSERALAARFAQLAPGQAEHDTTLEVEGRPIPARALADGVAWFDFAALCEGPRAVADYIEIARSFNTVLVAGVPQFGSAERDDAAKRFIHLVDEFYDRRVKLLLSAAAPALTLYPAGRLAAQFERTASRLVEMQGPAYLAQAHRP
jgi:cell division protein ZapE